MVYELFIVGTYYYANGDKYMGDMKNDKKDGRGIHTWKK